MPRGTILTKFGETRLLQEYVTREYSRDVVFLRLRLGALAPLNPEAASSDAERAMVGVFRRWADAVAVRANELVVIEAKVRSNPGAVAQLLLYRELVPFTLELQPYLGRPLVLELVQAIEDPAVNRLCAAQGIRCRLYKPDWLGVYLSQLHRRETRAPRDFASEAPQA